jgi:glycosyltransferase involved in cell wall biosynthesis
VALVDPVASGHHSMYAQGYLEAISKSGCEVMMLAPPRLLKTLTVPIGLEQRATLVPWAALDDDKLFGDAQTHAEQLWESLGTTLSAAAASAPGRYPDLIVLLYLDAFITELLPASVIRGHVACPVAGLWFKPPRSGRLRWRERFRRLTRLGRRYRLFQSPLFYALLLLDPEAARAVPGHHRMRIIGTPEFTDTALPQVAPPILETIRQSARGRRIYCLVGSIDRRKGVRGFLKAVAAAPPMEWFFVIAGRVAWHSFDDETRDVLRKATSNDRDRVLLIDEWLPAGTLNAIIQASDLLHACYEDWPYSSNMLCKAAVCGTPAVGTTDGYIGRNLKRYDLGFLVPRAQKLEALFVSGFGTVVAAHRRSDAFAAGCRGYLAANDNDALFTVIKSLIRELPER